MIEMILFLAAAGCGALGRAVVGRRLNRHGGFAVGTFAVNLAASLTLGLLHNAPRPVLTVVGTGLLGALSTFSSFAADTMALANARKYALAAVYLSTTLVACLLAAATGIHFSPG